MLKRLLLPAAAAVIGLGAAVFQPAPANAASLAGAASVTHQNALGVSDVTQVQHRHRHRGHRHHGRHHHHHWHRPHFGWGFYAPQAFAPRCGHVWSPRYHRHVWRCW